MTSKLSLLFLLVAGPVYGQSLIRVPSFQDEGAIQAVQQLFDEKYSVRGGTITGTVHITTGLVIAGTVKISTDSDIESLSVGGTVQADFFVGDGSGLKNILVRVSTSFAMPIFSDDQGNSLSYTTVGKMLFPGQENMGGSPDRIIINGFKVSGGGSCDYRMQDVTNSLTIVEFTGVSDTSTTNIFDMGSLANIPQTAAIWEIQTKRVGGGTKCEVGVLTVEW